MVSPGLRGSAAHEVETTYRSVKSRSAILRCGKSCRSLLQDQHAVRRGGCLRARRRPGGTGRRGGGIGSRVCRRGADALASHSAMLAAPISTYTTRMGKGSSCEDVGLTAEPEDVGLREPGSCLVWYGIIMGKILPEIELVAARPQSMEPRRRLLPRRSRGGGSWRQLSATEYACSDEEPPDHPHRAMNPLHLDVRGVNLGGWMVLQPWITPSLFYQFEGRPPDRTAMDMHSFCEVLGPQEGNRQLREHWRKWVTEREIRKIAEQGLNTVRVPVGDWMWLPYDPYIG
eukprot:3601031-Pleurochrysis_carterae.AAC.3